MPILQLLSFIYLILIRLMGYEYCIQVSGNFRFAFFLIYLGLQVGRARSPWRARHGALRCCDVAMPMRRELMIAID